MIMNNIVYIYLALITTFFSTNLVVVAGVVIGADVPQVVLEVVAQLDSKLKQEVSEVGEQSEHQFLFDTATKYYLPHLTMAYLVNGNASATSLDDLLASNNDGDEFKKALSVIAQDFDKIDLTENLVQAELEFWQGKFPVELTLDNANKKLYTNYCLVVLKLKESQQLLDLAGQVRGLVDEKLSIKQRFPFGAHLTIGRVVSVDDHNSVHELVGSKLKPKFAGKKVNELGCAATGKVNFVVREIKLKDDKREEAYRLN